jgi:sulfide:quinone oxidoreductase
MTGSEAATASRSARPGRRAGSRVLEGIAAGYGIEVRRESQLTEVNGEAGRAVIAGTKETIDFYLLHAVPPIGSSRARLPIPRSPPGTCPPTSTP